MNTVFNRKTKKPYILQGTVVDATNSAGGKEMALYQSVEDGSLYVRDAAEFKEKFTSQYGVVKDVLLNQCAPTFVLLPIIQGLVTRLDKLIAIFQLCTEPAPGCSKEEESMLQSDIDDHVAFIEELAVSGLYRPLVVKIQRPLFCSAGLDGAPYLVYNEDRTLYEEMTMDEEIKNFFEPQDLKIYAKARLWVDGTLQIVSRVEDMPW